MNNINMPYWYGKEVEGRFSGLETVFIHSEFPADVLDYPHIYILSRNIETATESVWKSCFDMIVKHNKMITIEVDDGTGQLEMIPPRLLTMVHILLRVKSKDIGKIKQLDTVSLDERMYNCYLAPKYILQRTTEEDYNIDIFKI